MRFSIVVSIFNEEVNHAFLLQKSDKTLSDLIDAPADAVVLGDLARLFKV